MMKLFKDTSGAVATCHEKWDMSNGLFPIPKEEIPCPCCGNHTLTCRQINIHTRDNSPNRYRCLMSFKCINCSHVPVFGVVISEEMYMRVQHELAGTHIPWRTAQKALQDIGAID